MENNIEQVSSKNEAAVETVATPVQQKEDWKTKVKNFGKKHKKGLIAGAIALVGTIVFCATRKGDEDGSLPQIEAPEMAIPGEIIEE